MAKVMKIRKKNTIRDAMTFLRAWVRHPRRVGAIAPSSCALADLITAEIAPPSAPVIELGAGTGVFTRALLERGVPERMLALVESHPMFAWMLRLRFPTAQVFCLDAARLGKVRMFEGVSAGAIVSGLPLLSMPRGKVMAILAAAFRHLRPDASFYQFTYGSRCPVPRAILDRLGLKARRLGVIAGNLPPATVFRIRRRRAK